MTTHELLACLDRYRTTFGEPYPLPAADAAAVTAAIERALRRGAPLSASERGPTPQLVAHRGDARRFPENTIESLSAAVAAGASWLEFDVQLTRDRVPVLLHDATLERTAGRPGSILELSAAEARAIEVHEPARFGDAFAGTRMPSLAEVVAALAQWRGVGAFVEIKRQSLAAFGVETTVSRVLDELAPQLARCVVISFDPRAVRAARRLGGGPIGWVLRRYDDRARRVARRMRPQYLFCRHDRLPPAPAPLWTGPWHWVCYEVTSPTLARRLARRGVAMIESMAVTEMSTALARGAAAPAGDG